MREWREDVAKAVAKGDGKRLVALYGDMPTAPDEPEAEATRLAPFRSFLTDVRREWSAAKRHTLAVYGGGKRKGDIVWTGTLAALVGKRPAKGVIAKGRRVC